jgi:phosphohistidine phosphatase SixA
MPSWCGTGRPSVTRRTFDLADVSKQRNLNDKGKRLAKAFGEALRGAGVPIGKVYTNQFNRAYETAVRNLIRDRVKSGLAAARVRTRRDPGSPVWSALI